jgi:hypothetical protein
VSAGADLFVVPRIRQNAPSEQKPAQRGWGGEDDSTFYWTINLKLVTREVFAYCGTLTGVEALSGSHQFTAAPPAGL